MDRINLAEHIFTMNKNPEPVFERDIEKGRATKAYTYSGLRQDRFVNEESVDAYAKHAVINARNFYFVKVGKVGRRNGVLADPKSVDFNKGETGLRVGGNPVYDWIKVSKKVFDAYTKYLNTGEKKWLAEARNLLKS